MTPALTLRRATPDERPLVAASWFESYRRGGSSPNVQFEVYKAGQGGLITRLIDRSEVWVATLPAVPDEVCGWVARVGPVVHYVYVKQAYRRLGIARALVNGTGPRPEWHTHETRPVGRSFAQALGTRYNPWLVHEWLTLPASL